MIIERDDDLLLVFCGKCSWGYTVTDYMAARDAYESHLRSRNCYSGDVAGGAA